jgi:hypothetical protein
MQLQARSVAARATRARTPMVSRAVRVSLVRSVPSRHGLRAITIAFFQNRDFFGHRDHPNGRGDNSSLPSDALAPRTWTTARNASDRVTPHAPCIAQHFDPATHKKQKKILARISFFFA